MIVAMCWIVIILVSGGLSTDGEAGLGIWTKPVGPEGAQLWALAVAPSDPRVVYAGTQDYGGYKSTDRGETWIKMVEKLPVGASGIDVRPIVVDPTNPDVVYAASGDGGLPPLAVDAVALFHEDSSGYGFGGKGSGGMSKSVDGGRTWRAIQAGLTSKQVFALQIDPMNPQVLYAGTIKKGSPAWLYPGEYESSGVFKSMDGGERWQQLDGGALRTSAVVALALDPQHPQVLYAGTLDRGLFRSVDEGMTWQHLGTGPQKDVVTVVVVPGEPAVVYAGAYRQGVFKSVDEGQTWAIVSQGLPTQRVVVLARDPQRPMTLYTGTFDQGVFRSEDGGQTWQGVSEGLVNPTVLSLAVDPQDPRILYAGTRRGGVFQTTDGGRTWRQVNTGLGSVALRALALVPGIPPALYAGTEVGIFRSQDGGQRWQVWNEGLPEQVVTRLAVDSLGQMVYAATETGHLFRRGDSKSRWARIGEDRAWGPVTVLRVQPGDPDWVDVGTTRGGLWRSRDGGATWQQVFVGEIGALAVAPRASQVWYLGVEGQGVFRSEDEGETWVPLPRQPSDRRIRALAVDPRNPAIIYAGMRSGWLEKTEDGGRSWRPLPTYMSWQTNVAAILVSAGNPQYVYVGGGGAFRSTDGGISWSYLSQGLTWGGNDVRALVGNPEETLYAAAWGFAHVGGGVWAYTEPLRPVARFTTREAAVRKDGRLLILTILDATTSTSDVRGSAMTYQWTLKPTLPLLSGTLTTPLIAVQRPESFSAVLKVTTALSAMPQSAGRFLMAGKVPPLLGDVTGDGRVDVQDRSALGQRYGAKTGEVRYHPAADLEFDGRIDLRDLRLLDQVRRAGGASGKPASDTTGIAEDQGSSMQSALLPNVPNPFNAETVVRYQVGGVGSQPVVLRVYDLTGQVVRTLVETAQLPGEYMVVWNGRDETRREVASGVYLTRLVVGAFTATQKLLLVR